MPGIEDVLEFFLVMLSQHLLLLEGLIDAFMPTFHPGAHGMRSPFGRFLVSYEYLPTSVALDVSLVTYLCDL
jgi:hypothetical protein